MEMNKHGQSSSNASSTIPVYSAREAKALAEKLSKKETFREAVQVLVTWIQSGQFNASNSVEFLALIQLCHDYKAKLQLELEEFKGEAQKAEGSLRNKKCCIQLQLNDIEDLFKKIENENIRGNFTEAKIQEFQEMMKGIQDLKQSCSVDIKTERESIANVEMDSEYLQLEKKTNEESTKAESLTTCSNADEKISEYLDKCKEYESEIAKLQSELENRKKANEAYQNEMHIIAALSILLYDNFDGLNIDNIYSQLKNRFPATTSKEIEEIMRKNPTVFKETSPIEASKEKIWTCISIDKETKALWESLRKN